MKTVNQQVGMTALEVKTALRLLEKICTNNELGPTVREYPEIQPLGDIRSVRGNGGQENWVRI